jgi:hypothetical protein
MVGSSNFIVRLYKDGNIAEDIANPLPIYVDDWQRMIRMMGSDLSLASKFRETQ